MKYPFEKHKLDRARILKALDKVNTDIKDLQQTKKYLIRELKKL
jgi:hypothetical protein